MNDEVTFTLKGYDAITREVSEIGNGAHVLIPRKWTGKKVKVILVEEYETKTPTQNPAFDKRTA